MSLQIISNQTQEPCDHGWIHTERIAALGHSSLPDVTKRRLAQFDVTLTDPHSLFVKGLEQNNSGQHREAFDTFHAVTQLEWSFTAAHVERGNAAAALKLYSVALESYRNAIELDSSCTAAYYNTALTHVDLNDNQQAASWLIRLLKIDRAFKPAYIALAELLSRQRHDRSAIVLLIVAARTVPRAADPLVYAGTLYHRNTQTEAAIRCYKRALTIDPWNTPAFYYLGVTYFQRGDLPRAIRYLAEAANGDATNKLAAALLKTAYCALHPKLKRDNATQTSLFADR